MLTPLVIVPAVMGPVSVSPPAMLTVRLKAPPRVTLPRVVMVLVPVPLGTSAMELLVFAVSVPAVIPVFRFCVTAPAMSPAPSTTVPVALMVPRATVLAFWMVTAAALALVVLSVPAIQLDGRRTAVDRDRARPRVHRRRGGLRVADPRQLDGARLPRCRKCCRSPSAARRGW